MTEKPRRGSWRLNTEDQHEECVDWVHVRHITGTRWETVIRQFGEGNQAGLYSTLFSSGFKIWPKGPHHKCTALSVGGNATKMHWGHILSQCLVTCLSAVGTAIHCGPHWRTNYSADVFCVTSSTFSVAESIIIIILECETTRHILFYFLLLDALQFLNQRSSPVFLWIEAFLYLTDNICKVNRWF